MWRSLRGEHCGTHLPLERHRAEHLKADGGYLMVAVLFSSAHASWCTSGAHTAGTPPACSASGLLLMLLLLFLLLLGLAALS